MQSITAIPRRAALLRLAGIGLAGWAFSPAVFAQEQPGAIPIPAVRATHWAQRWLQLVVKYQQNPLRAARSIAYTQVAMRDAWLQAVKTGNQDEAIGELCAHRAASLVLQHFYPNEMPGHIEAQYVWMREQLGLPAQAGQEAHTMGTEVALATIERSLLDGAGRTWPVRNRPADFPGIWQATYPLYSVNPVEAWCGTWRPWVVPAENRYTPPPAHRPGSEQHRMETEEVLAEARQLTPQQREAAFRWNLESGSVTPPGVWMQYAIAKLTAFHAGTEFADFDQCTRVLATLTMAMHDAFIACWGIKFRDWSERPITAVRRELEKDFVPVVVTPGFPAYVSGHATVSGAAAAVLSSFWPSDAETINAMAEEAAMSRLWGGIHFRSDNDEGLRLGTAVGREVMAAR